MCKFYIKEITNKQNKKTISMFLLIFFFSLFSLDPPPEPSSVVVVKRKYSSLARDLNYKKRVTWFDMSPELPVAVVEYIP